MEKGFAIADVKVKNRLVLAPMAGISDLAFRLLCREQGAGLCFTEMINAEAISRNNKSSFRLAQTCKKDRPLGLQLFGARTDSMKKAAKELVSCTDFDFFDLNLGCPDPNVLKQGAGAALLKRSKRAQEIVKALSRHGKPVTAKIRLSSNVLHSIRFCKALEQAGASAISVHAKTVKQLYSGQANFVAVKRIAKAVSVPVIANGNIATSEDVEKTLASTKAEAVMLGRAAIANPGVFAELQGSNGIKPLDALFKYLELCSKHGVRNFGKKKIMVSRFLAKARQKHAGLLLQKAQNDEEIWGLVEALRKNKTN